MINVLVGAAQKGGPAATAPQPLICAMFASRAVREEDARGEIDVLPFGCIKFANQPQWRFKFLLWHASPQARHYTTKPEALEIGLRQGKRCKFFRSINPSLQITDILVIGALPVAMFKRLRSRAASTAKVRLRVVAKARQGPNGGRDEGAQ